MFLILDEAIPSQDTVVTVNRVSVNVRAGSLLVYACLTPRSHQRTPPTSGWFPVLVDTGHSSNLSINSAHFSAWVPYSLASFQFSGSIQFYGVGGPVATKVPRYDASLWIRSNQIDVPPLRIDLNRGFNLHQPSNPAIPLLGVRAIQEAKLHLCAYWDRGRFSICRQRKLFGEWLVHQGAISQAELEVALDEQVSLRLPLLHQVASIQNPNVMARILRTSLVPIHVGIRMGELPVARELIPQVERDMLFPPDGDVSTLLGEILVRRGALSSGDLQRRLALFQETIWH